MQRDFSRSMLQGPHTWPAASTQHAYRSSQMRSTVIFVIALLAATESALGFTLSTGPIAVPALDHSRRIPAQQRPLSVRAKEAGPALRMAGGVTEVPLAVKAAKTGTLVYGILIGAGGISAGVKTGSKPSIISSAVAAVLLAVAYMKSLNVLALATSTLLSIVFAIRFAKTNKIMPAGVLGTISVGFSALFAAAQLGI